VLQALVVGLSLLAAAKPSPTVVLVHEQEGVPAAWHQALLDEARSGLPEGSWIDPPSIPLGQVQVALGCPSWNTACAAKVSSMTKAQHALLVEVRAGEHPGLDVQLVKSSDGKVVDKAHTWNVSLPAGEDGLVAARRVVAAAAAGRRPAFLYLTSTPPGVDVVVAGQAKGVTPRLLAFDDDGTIEAQFSATGFLPTQSSFAVSKGELTLASVALQSTEAPTVEAKAAGATSEKAPNAATTTAKRNLLPWMLVGGGGVVAVVGLVPVVAFLVPTFDAIAVEGQAKGGVVPPGSDGTSVQKRYLGDQKAIQGNVVPIVVMGSLAGAGAIAAIVGVVMLGLGE
jgi:hypothetical protein